MFNKLTFSLLSGLLVFDATAQTFPDVRTNSQSSAYAQDGRGTITRSGTGLCWRTGYWSTTDAATGCDGELTSPLARPTAPDLVPSTAKNADAAPLALIAPASRCDFSITLQGDIAFAFGKANIAGNAGDRIKHDYQDRVGRCSRIESISVTGHTDRIGSVANNAYLSEQRAKAAAALLGINLNSTQVSIAGIGSTQSITSCPENLTRSELIACLADDRRATIEVHGEAR
ncbi:OmpA family protein [Actimicrobium sp. CCI2.3]|uniref:OmpA family protein n=1 Tax=Actimicrobium sp. CCI2.3 TaxID=3048616 RepID=UPI002AB51376|nr:OmpA family protein [Actimicrobium sp. CCI2.3]MDY7575950.1 OmpA family protein [Actimicrobium sp. CCI2.3]MEB0023216.1 OmpA family protein [Actimicrobium sp. CCI2.3]